MVRHLREIKIPLRGYLSVHEFLSAMGYVPVSVKEREGSCLCVWLLSSLNDHLYVNWFVTE